MSDEIKAVKDGLQQLHGELQAQHNGFTDINVSRQFELLGRMMDIIAAQEARIKALEDRLDSIPPAANYPGLF